MAKTVDYYFSLSSPWTYLGSLEFARLCEDTSTTVNFRPSHLKTVFAATEGLPVPERAPERQAYRLVELERWGAYRQMDINLHPAHWPFDDTLAVGAMLAAEKAGADLHALTHSIMRAAWAEDRDMTNPEHLATVLSGLGLDSKALLAVAADQSATRKVIDANTETAIAAGVFGAPSYLYENELFWGQDRLEFLGRALAR